jgi:site-specific DNA-methyltransferase (adenine-specific)
MLKQVYNPDVLTCIANLSSDEVFTPPSVVNQMLDTLPKELWSDEKVTFLDPVSKSGVFLREITKRLIDGLEDKIPKLEERIEHILRKQVFGIGITELTSLISRRTLYCSKYANGKYSIVQFDNKEGNLNYFQIEHTWENGKCKHCGVSKELYDRGDELENYSYPFLHIENLQKTFKMKFDVILGNPPYQMADGSGGSTDSATPVYNKFIDIAIKLNPKYLTMIIPSKWMVGGRGLNRFRNEMFNETRIKKLVDFENASECFPGVHIDGGVCYFLWDKDYDGEIEYTFKGNDKSITTTKRKLENPYYQYVIRDNRIMSLIEKVSVGDRFSNIVSPTKPYGIRKFLFNEPHRYADANLSDKEFDNSVRIYGVKGIKGGAKRKVGYVTRRTVVRNEESIDKYKLFFTTSYSTNAVEPPEVILGNPKDVCTETFLLVGPFGSKTEQMNCYHYMQTQFFKALLYFGKGTMQVTSSVFGLIPLVDFNKRWTDEDLFKYFHLSEGDIEFIQKLFVK